MGCVGVGWDVRNEGLMEDFKGMEKMKVGGSYGVIGKEGMGG